ncbi:MAG: hypothetical protein MRY79_07700 [Alphaproteobacteria bacterium]|nr:hypothetical protein [Alphaproteobacteria bacterium]
MMTDRTHILSQDPRQAIEEMIKISEELVARIETESSAVANNDGTTFTINEMNKEGVADLYQQAANEFHARLPEFKNVDKSLIAKLDEVQKSLGQSTKNNLALLAKLQEEE